MILYLFLDDLWINESWILNLESIVTHSVVTHSVLESVPLTWFIRDMGAVWKILISLNDRIDSKDEIHVTLYPLY